MISESTMLTLLGSIYQAAGNSDLWRVFLEQLAGILQSSATGIISYDLGSGKAIFRAAVRTDPESLKRYSEYYSTKDIWLARGERLIETGFIETSQMLCPDEELDQSEYYNDYLRPQGLFHQCGGVIVKQEGRLSVIASMRSKRSGAFSDNATEVLRMLLPHLRQALFLHHRITTLESKLHSSTEVLNRLPFGVVLVDTRCLPVFINRTAEAIFARDDGLKMKSDGLHAANSVQSTDLRTMISKCVMTGLRKTWGSGGEMPISRPSSNRPFYVLVTPIGHESFFAIPERPVAAVFIKDPEAALEPSARVLSRLFGLTPAESRVAFLLTQGKSMAETAVELSLSKNTIRTHVAQLLSKTDTHRQSELLRVLIKSAILINEGSSHPFG